MAPKKPGNIEVERHPYGGLVIYEVSGDELDTLEKETAAISEDLSFALVGLSFGVAFSIALSTTAIPSDRTFSVFVLVTIISYLDAAYFGIRWLRGRSKTTTIVAEIKKRVGPLGEEGKELEPQELASLPTQEASRPGEQAHDNPR
jgi:hypothetical protein